jgi:hypothetical protein
MQALALAAAQEEKLAYEAANKQALQDITNQYMQLAKRFDAKAKWKTQQHKDWCQQIAHAD